MKIYKRVPVKFMINGEPAELEVEAGETALHVLRNRLGLKGTKEGCGIGECGACTVVAAGKSVNACLMPAARLDGQEILTVEGLGSADRLHPLQQSFLDGHAVQCGFCTPGILMSAHALLGENPTPNREEIVEAVSGNLCRCTGYRQIVDAVADAARKWDGEREK